MWTCAKCSVQNQANKYKCSKCWTARYDHATCIQLLKQRQIEINRLKQEQKNQTLGFHSSFEGYRQQIKQLNQQNKKLKKTVTTHNKFLRDSLTIKQVCGHSMAEIIPRKLDNETKQKFMRVFHGYIRQKTNFDLEQLPSRYRDDIIAQIAYWYPCMEEMKMRGEFVLHY